MTEHKSTLCIAANHLPYIRTIQTSRHHISATRGCYGPKHTIEFNICLKKYLILANKFVNVTQALTQDIITSLTGSHSSYSGMIFKPLKTLDKA